MGSGFWCDNEEDTQLLDEALAEEQLEEDDKNIKIAIVGRPDIETVDLNQSYFRRRTRGGV